jgi:predicted TIM-barrel fold metal-dependent hydrolase
MDQAGVSRAVAVGLESEDNSAIVEATADHPTRLIPFVMASPEEAPGAIIERSAVETGIQGIGEVYLGCGPSQLPEAHLRPVLESAREHDLPVMIHTGDFSYSAPLLMTDMARTFPDVAFILAHMGSIAFVLDAIEAAKTFSNIDLETSGMTSPSMLRRAVAECGPERILFGSDYPYWHPLVERTRIEAARLDPGAKRIILGENVIRLLAL